ncbi:MAG TPA: DUF296 domain-containing protein [Thermoplasmataceae archaeon]|nr:DUF296 domain-containing protein [Thermoplasmatales archaeon AK]HLH85565.1 DUF296 domain-containing protein [Thermoplasmataceae archaeon]
MQISREGELILVKIEYGENVKDTILKVIQKEKISSGEVTWGIGMIRNLQVGYYNGGSYEKETFSQPLEIVSFHGSIAGNEPLLHIHCSGASRDHVVHGGHFFDGIADPLLEVSIRRFDAIKIERRENARSKLMEISLVRP